MMYMVALLAAAVTVVSADQISGYFCKVPDDQLYLYRVPKHNCQCDNSSEGTLRYFKKTLQICNGKTFVDVGGGFPATKVPTKPPTPKPTTPKPTTPPPIGDKSNPGRTCNEIISKRSGAGDGYYYLKEDGHKGPGTKTYCFMSQYICGSRGWTMIMKINGRSSTFRYDSNLWTNENEYNPRGADSGLSNQETKLKSYSTYKFKRLCLGMRVGGSLRWLTVNYNGKSLYHVIASGRYKGFHVGRHAWKNLVPNSSLQSHCNREGFNVIGHHAHSKARIGIIANQENECRHPDSRIGFGTGGGACGEHQNNSAGNEARCHSDRGDRSIYGFGYIFAQ